MIRDFSDINIEDFLIDPSTVVNRDRSGSIDDNITSTNYDEDFEETESATKQSYESYEEIDEESPRKSSVAAFSEYSQDEFEPENSLDNSYNSGNVSGAVPSKVNRGNQPLDAILELSNNDDDNYKDDEYESHHSSDAGSINSRSSSKSFERNTINHPEEETLQFSYSSEANTQQRVLAWQPAASIDKENNGSARNQSSDDNSGKDSYGSADKRQKSSIVRSHIDSVSENPLPKVGKSIGTSTEIQGVLLEEELTRIVKERIYQNEQLGKQSTDSNRVYDHTLITNRASSSLPTRKSWRGTSISIPTEQLQYYSDRNYYSNTNPLDIYPLSKGEVKLIVQDALEAKERRRKREKKLNQKNMGTNTEVVKVLTYLKNPFGSGSKNRNGHNIPDYDRYYEIEIELEEIIMKEKEKLFLRTLNYQKKLNKSDVGINTERRKDLFVNATTQTQEKARAFGNLENEEQVNKPPFVVGNPLSHHASTDLETVLIQRRSDSPLHKKTITGKSTSTTSVSNRMNTTRSSCRAKSASRRVPESIENKGIQRKRSSSGRRPNKSGTIEELLPILKSASNIKDSISRGTERSVNSSDKLLVPNSFWYGKSNTSDIMDTTHLDQVVGTLRLMRPELATTCDTIYSTFLADIIGKYIKWFYLIY